MDKMNSWFGPMAFIALAIALSACFPVNQDIEIEDGSVVERQLSSVNGAVRVGQRSTVTGGVANVNGSITIGSGSQVGELRNVNGSISLADDASAQSIEAVNGAVRLGTASHIHGAVMSVNGGVEVGPDSRIDGTLSNVNGALRLEPGVTVQGGVSTTNGPIRLRGATVGGIQTRRGGIEVLDGSIVNGDLRIPRSDNAERGGPVRVVIGRNAQVLGSMEFEREVRLYVHETAIIGPVSGAEVVFFSDEAPRGTD